LTSTCTERFVPTAKFWRETGVLTSAVSGNEILRRCVDGGLLLPPSDLFGAPHGYLPGPAAFKHKIHHPPIRGLPALPTFEEITCNARVRALSRFAQLMKREFPLPRRCLTSSTSRRAPSQLFWLPLQNRDSSHTMGHKYYRPIRWRSSSIDRAL